MSLGAENFERALDVLRRSYEDVSSQLAGARAALAEYKVAYDSLVKQRDKFRQERDEALARIANALT